MDELGIELEVQRQSPKTFRSFSSHLFDHFFFLLLAGLFFFLLQLSFSALPIEKRAWAIRERIQQESALYIKEEDRLTNIGDYYDSEDYSYTVGIEKMSNALDYYFSSYFLEDEWAGGTLAYNQRRSEALAEDGQKLFGENGMRLLTNPDYDEDYFRFYKEAAKDFAPGYLDYKKGYSEARQTIVVFFFLALELGLLLSYLAFFLIPPLLFHRGKQTIGMKLTGLYLLDATALSPGLGRYLLFRLAHYFFFIVAGPFTLFIPQFISIGMMLLRDTHQTLMEYVFALFPVEAKKSEIYETSDEISIEVE